MIKSMTGYGYAQYEDDQLQVVVEIKSLNSKYFDVNLKLPKQFSEKEIDLRSFLSNKLERGKITLSIEFQKKAVNEPQIKVNDKLFKSYYHTFQQLADTVNANTTELFRFALEAPEVMVPELEHPDIEDDYKKLLKVIEEAVSHCNDFRKKEGEVLKNKIADYADEIEKLDSEIEKYENQRIQQVKERLKNSINELLTDNEYDANRFEQELIYYLEKLDITEEKVRLKSHTNYFKNVLQEESGPHGKKLNFITQEMNREINTIGSKANHADIQRLVIRMKEELEKIKEQVQNIL